MDAQRSEPRVLVYSLRNIFGKALFRCAHYEFEDIICEIDSAELLAPELDPHSAHSRFAMRLAYHAPVTLIQAFEQNQRDRITTYFLRSAEGWPFPSIC